MRNKAFNILNKCGVSYLLRKAKEQNITVVSLHRISEKRDYFFDPISPEVFESFISYCAKNYEVISFSEINKRTRKPKMILSFDDGYYDFIEYAIPILSKYNLPSNHNLVNICLNGNAVIWTQKLNDIFNYLRNNSIVSDGTIDDIGGGYKNNWDTYYISFFHQLLKLSAINRNSVLQGLAAKYGVSASHKMMNWDDAKKCAEKYKVEIGCHTYNHESLLNITDENELENEIGKSIDELENKLNKKIEILALPNGQYNEEVLRYCKKREIKYILLVNDKTNTENSLLGNFNLVNRVYLVNEDIHEMILRTELFHSKIKEFL